ncbi:MAG: helix-turn-helix domain-containing protein [Bacteroidales bacterium]|nr:helix-turn-helix domain-containing protein [Bacteroidales bacterium]MCI2122218.1 helix-turn-helix domain-containing protein [Bacteroidales bacterium]MCI2145554.1 helix-turn-helix domain-containing protein [Bacteroidales bacterium]
MFSSVLQLFVSAVILLRSVGGFHPSATSLSGCCYCLFVPFLMADCMRISPRSWKPLPYFISLVVAAVSSFSTILFSHYAVYFKIISLALLYFILFSTVAKDCSSFVNYKDRNSLVETGILLCIVIALSFSINTTIGIVVVLISETYIIVTSITGRNFKVPGYLKTVDDAFELQEPSAPGNGADPEFAHLELLVERLIKYMESSRHYLSPDIRINDVAAHLSTNKTYLSRAISRIMYTNFTQFVHHFRIRDAIVMIKEEPGISLGDLCERCGFRSMSSFTNAFKCNTGRTPGEWKRIYIISNGKEETFDAALVVQNEKARS